MEIRNWNRSFVYPKSKEGYGEFEKAASARIRRETQWLGYPEGAPDGYEDENQRRRDEHVDAFLPTIRRLVKLAEEFNRLMVLVVDEPQRSAFVAILGGR